MKRQSTPRPKRSVRVRMAKITERRLRGLPDKANLPSTPVGPYVPVPNERNARIAFRNEQYEEKRALARLRAVGRF